MRSKHAKNVEVWSHTKLRSFHELFVRIWEVRSEGEVGSGRWWTASKRGRGKQEFFVPTARTPTLRKTFVLDLGVFVVRNNFDLAQVKKNEA